MKKTKVLTVITNGACITFRSTFGIHKIHLHNIRKYFGSTFVIHKIQKGTKF